MKCIAGIPLRMPPGNAVVHCRRCTVQCRRVCESLLHEFHCLVPQGSEMVHCKNGSAHCPHVVRQCIGGAALPIAPK